MPFRTVLTIAGIGPADRDIKSALDLCEEVEAHLSVLLIAMAAPPPIGEYAISLSQAWLEEREQDTKMLTEKADELEALLAKRGLSADLSTEYVEEAGAEGAIGTRARYSDLVVVGPDVLGTVNLKRHVVNGVLFHAQRPLLLLPEGARPSLRPQRVLIGWNSSVEASRAIREAAELISQATDVRVVMVDPQSADRANGPEPGADVAAYLARHGAKVTVDRLPSSGLTVAELLKRHAIDVAADMIVMGAYGRTRLRERIFGGVTQDMLSGGATPVFLAR